MSRRTIAIVVILIWITGLGLLYRRNTNRTPDQMLAEAGMRVSPATYYYILEQNGRQVGAASSALDTTDTRIVATDFVRGEIPVGDDVLRMEARSESRYTRGMKLRDFVIRAAGDLTPFMLRGAIQEGEDKTLRVTVESADGKPITQEAVVTTPIFTPTVAPLPLMLRAEPEMGDTLRVAIFEPVSRSVKEVTLKVETDSLFLLADSAHIDTATGRWVKARQDSVRGWRITGASSPITVWVDADGRLVAASEPGGITMLRTAFEMAFENWRLDRPGAAPTPRRPRQ